MKSRWKTYLLYSGIVIIGGGLILFLIRVGYSYPGTGFGEYTPSNTDTVRGKTFWDWMQLLIIPLFLAGGVFFLNLSERKTDREIAKDRQQEEALQAYFDRMSGLLLEKKLRTTEEEEVRDIARIQTFTVLRGLDGKRKSIVLYFLYEAHLINKEKPVVKLFNADFTAADLSYMYLEAASLIGANFSQANLQHALLSKVEFQSARLNNANLQFSILGVTDLTDADLRGANMHRAILDQTNLAVAKLEGATMPDGTIHE